MNRILVAAAGILALSACLDGVDLDPANRWQIRDYYRSVYMEGASAQINWSGNYASGQAGTVSPEWQAAALNRINYFRKMSGVPADVVFNPAFNAGAQQAALMMSAAGRLSHNTDASWPWYTAEAGEAAFRGNLALGVIGANAVTNYISDFGQSNANVGHRRWLLYPQNTTMGNGDVPGDINQGLKAANVMRVVPLSFGDRPDTRDNYVAWPPKGHVPATLVFARWSFSHPEADFANAQVSMKSGGQDIPVSLEALDTRFIGEPTIVWVPNNMDTNANIHWPLPTEDELVEVTVSNALVDGSPTEFSYTVRIFNPDIAGETEFPTSIATTGPVIPTVPAAFSVSSRSWAEGVQGRVIHAVTHDTVDGAESGLSKIDATLSAGYSGIQNNRVASGTAAFHLATPNHTQPQTLLLKDEFIILPGPAQLSFASSLAWATVIQVASVEINVGSGEAWETIWSIRGPVLGNDTFTNVSIDLTPWEGQTARFRFRYEVDGLSQYYIDVGGHFGWAIDDIALTGISCITGIDQLSPQMGGNTLWLTLEDMETVFLQARDIAFNGRPQDWGPIITVSPAQHTAIQSVEGQWVQDPVLGWNFANDPDWTYFLGLGWAYVKNFPWVYTSEGWSYYLRGSMDSGIWLYNPGIGHIYTRSVFGNWYQHEPFDDNSWKQFGR